jgi:molybdate transport system substrate-binding protein
MVCATTGVGVFAVQARAAATTIANLRYIRNHLKSIFKSTEIILNYLLLAMTITGRRCVTKLLRRLLTGITVLAAFSTPVAAQPPGLVVSVAASMHDALAEIAGLYRAATGVTVALNTGSSNTLARQIVEGAGAALFLSADDIQMDVVDKAGRIVPGTRRRLLTNELAIVVPAEAPRSITMEQLLAGAVNRVAMGEPSAVPAGVYGRRFFERQGAWALVQPKVVPFPTVRGVLAAVEAGRVDAGVVYRTDAMTARVQVIARVADLDIAHSAAVIKGPKEAPARAFLDFLETDRSRAVFARRGFGMPSVVREPKPSFGRVDE